MAFVVQQVWSLRQVAKLNVAVVSGDTTLNEYSPSLCGISHAVSGCMSQLV